MWRGVHLLAEVVDEVAVDLETAAALGEFVDATEDGVARERSELVEQVQLLALEEVVRLGPPVLPRGAVPERAEVHAHHLRHAHDAAQLPHKRAVDPQKLLRRNRVRLVQHHTCDTRGHTHRKY